MQKIRLLQKKCEKMFGKFIDTYDYGYYIKNSLYQYYCFEEVYITV